MANEIRHYTLTIPAGTTSAAPAILDTLMPPRTVTGIEIVVPPGVNGVVGFQVLNSHLPVIPYGSDAWIIANGEIINWPLEGFINSGSWQLAGYNTGVNDHSLLFRFLVDFIPLPAAAVGGTVLSADTLTGTVQPSDTLYIADYGGDGADVDLSAINA